MNDEPISPIMMAGAQVWPDITPGITELSIIRKPVVLNTL